VSKQEKLKAQILGGASNANIAFADLCWLLERLGFDARQKGGSHRVFKRQGVEEILNLQEKAGKAKPYQVRQVSEIIRKYEL